MPILERRPILPGSSTVLALLVQRPLPARVAGTLVIALSLSTVGCSPVFNWRDVSVGDDGALAALLPCKPDQAARDVVLAGNPASLQMTGCKAGGATFTIARASAPDRMRAAAWLADWQRSVAAKFVVTLPGQAVPPSAGEGSDAAPRMALVEQPFPLSGAAAAPPPVRWRIAAPSEGRQSAGSAAPAKPGVEIVWFMGHPSGSVAGASGSTGTAVYQAIVLGAPEDAQAASTFFEGLQLR